MFISAVTAYYADIWGRRLGKKRKTIGRLRPKHTAIVIITSAGAVIALLSFVILLTADAGIRRALLNWDQTVAEKRALETQLAQQKTDLEAQIAAKQDQVNRNTALIASAEGRVKEATRRLASVQKDLAATQAERTAAQKQLADSKTQLASVQASLKQIATELATTSNRLKQTRVTLRAQQEQLKNGYRVLSRMYQAGEQANAAVARTLQGEVAARKGDELGRIVVPRGVSLTQAREALRRLLNDAGRLVQQRAKSSKYEGNPFVAVRPKMVYQAVNGRPKQVWLSGQKSMDLAAAGLAGANVPPGGTVVRVVAKANAMGGDTVPVDFELFENHVIFDRNQVIGSLEIKASDGKPAVMNALTGALKDVRAKALESGLIPAADGSVGSLPAYQLPDVFSEIMRARREGQQLIAVRVMAAKETWTSDELELKFEVQRYTRGG
jgi:hypothetical protein